MKSLIVTVAGVRVRVRLGDDGRPLSASAGIERPGDLEHERLVHLAADRALEAAEAATEQAQRKVNSAKAAVQSVEKRASATANEWLATAHEEHPDYGKDRLTKHARRLAADAGIELAKRDEITEERARRFLERRRKPPA